MFATALIRPTDTVGTDYVSADGLAPYMAPIINDWSVPQVTAPPMLNANRPATDVPQQLPTVAVTAPANTAFDWKKYIPWLLVLLVILAIVYSMKKQKAE